MSHLTYTVRIPPTREEETDQAIQMFLNKYPQQMDILDILVAYNDALAAIFSIGVDACHGRDPMRYAQFNKTVNASADKWKDENL